MAICKTLGSGLRAVLMVGAFVLVASCSGDDWDEPVPQPPPPAQLTSEAVILGQILVVFLSWVCRLVPPWVVDSLLMRWSVSLPWRRSRG